MNLQRNCKILEKVKWKTTYQNIAKAVINKEACRNAYITKKYVK